MGLSFKACIVLGRDNDPLMSYRRLPRSTIADITRPKPLAITGFRTAVLLAAS